MSLREKRRAHRARARRVEHPLHERLIPDLEGAPDPIRDEQTEVIKAIEGRRSVVEKHREAQAAKAEAPAKDAEATKAPLAQGKAGPKPTAEAAASKVDELRRQGKLANEVVDEALDRLAAVVGRHADEWQANLDPLLREDAEATAEQTAKARAAWETFDARFTVTRWLHQHDPEHPRSLAQTRGLSIGEVTPDKMLTGLTKVAEQAPQTAVAGVSGRELRAQARAERKARRREKVAA